MAPEKRTNAFAALITPLPDGETPSRGQRKVRIQAFRQILGEYGNIHQDRIVYLLKCQNWDLPAALQQFQIELELMRANHRLNAPGRSPEQQALERVLSAPTRHELHRRAIDQVYLDIAAFDPTIPTQIPPFRAAMLLNDNGWNVNEARDDHFRRANDPNIVADDERRERRLRINEPGADTPNACHRGERLALFLEIAGTDDWVSVLAFLKKIAWDLVHAVEVWLHEGLPTVQPTTAQRKAIKYRAPTEPHTESDNVWPSNRPSAPDQAAIDQGVDASDQADAAENYKQGAYAGRSGWLIDHDYTPARAGIPNPSKLRVRYIMGEAGAVAEYVGTKKAGTGLRASDDTPAIPAEPDEMDFFNTEHISDLNRWRGQFPRRVASGLQKTVTQFSSEEEKWLFDWMFEERRQARLRDSSVGQINHSMKKLFTDFNARFKGTTPTGASEPRPERTQQSLDMKRRRMPEIVQEFGLLPPPPPPKRRKGGDRDGSEDESEEESDDELEDDE